MSRCPPIATIPDVVEALRLLGVGVGVDERAGKLVRGNNCFRDDGMWLRAGGETCDHGTAIYLAGPSFQCADVSLLPDDLRRFIFFANRGTVRYSDHEDQTTQAHCHTLVVNTCILSTTGYLQDAVHAERADGRPVSDEAIAHLSPGQYETINPYGTLTFDIPGVLKRPRRPPATPNPR